MDVQDEITHTATLKKINIFILRRLMNLQDLVVVLHKIISNNCPNLLRRIRFSLPIIDTRDMPLNHCQEACIRSKFSQFSNANLAKLYNECNELIDIQNIIINPFLKQIYLLELEYVNNRYILFYIINNKHKINKKIQSYW